MSALPARVVSVNVGGERLIPWRGKMVRTGIYKEPVAARITVRDDHVEGDTVADLRVHGGWSKAVYAYPAEHYAGWKQELPAPDLGWGAFGENLTVQGLSEETVAIGDVFRVGSAVLEVTEPRQPCFKLVLKFGRRDIVKRFLQSGRTGFYLAIVTPGDISAGDVIERTARREGAPTIAHVVRGIAAAD